MKTRKLSFRCPVCSSPDVLYTCTPNCCFNHVCGNCGATFEPATRATGAQAPPVTPPDPLPESTDPTASCAKCDSTEVYESEDGQLVCRACRALLELEMTAVQPAL